MSVKSYEVFQPNGFLVKLGILREQHVAFQGQVLAWSNHSMMTWNLAKYVADATSISEISQNFT